MRQIFNTSIIKLSHFTALIKAIRRNRQITPMLQPRTEPCFIAKVSEHRLSARKSAMTSLTEQSAGLGA